jgi:plasmid stabilization system protein ParE
MKLYQVEFSDVAESELIESIIWGIEVWGEEATFRWARKFRDKARKQLSRFPFGQPLAPESEFSEGEIRQLIIGRYRILYDVSGLIVNILHIRGSFAGQNKE